MKTKKVLFGVSATAVSLVLAGCGSSSNDVAQGAPEPLYNSTTIPEQPTDQHCNDWDWDADDYVWECEDSRSSYYGHYYYGGQYFNSISSLKNSKSGAAYTNQVNLSKSSSGSYSDSSSGSSSGSSSSTSSGSRSSSGFGSGSSSSGG